LPEVSVTKADPSSVREVFVNMAFPLLYLPFQTTVRLMGVVVPDAMPVQPVPAPVEEPVILPCWMTSVTPDGAPVTEQLDTLPLMLTVLPPAELVAGGLNDALTVTPVHETEPTAGPEKGTPLAAATGLPMANVRSVAGITNADAPNAILRNLIMGPPSVFCSVAVLYLPVNS
jgi:hypothetical protein